MGFRLHKSLKVAPGIRLNLSTRGVSTSFGVRGARVNVGHGRVNTTVGVPGTGLSHRTSTSTKAAAGQRAAPAPRKPSAPPAVALTRDERKLVNAIVDEDQKTLAKIAADRRNPDAPLAAFFAASFGVQEDATAATAMWTDLYRSGRSPNAVPLAAKVPAVRTLECPVSIADGVTVTMPVDAECVALVHAELLQGAGRADEAILVVEALESSAPAALSLAELYRDAERWTDIIDVTNGVANTDDLTALLVTYRAVALRHLGQYGPAREAFREALKSRSRQAAVRHLALLERAALSLDEGKRAAARKDLEKIFAEDASYPGLGAALANFDDVKGVNDDPGTASPPVCSQPSPKVASLAPPSIPAGWHPDPSGRHRLRYWNGTMWTAHVADAGPVIEDPL